MRIQNFFAKRQYLIPLIIFLLSEALFLVNLSIPGKVNYDEAHYIPAAKQVLNYEDPKNWEHPPLAKILIAIGMAIFDNPPYDNTFAWRIMSVLFGGITMVAMYFAGRNLFRSTRAGIYTAIFSISNFMIYVHSRIALLDTFMFAFMAIAMALFFDLYTSDERQIRSKNRTTKLYALGIVLGLGTSCKWFAIILWLGILGLISVIKLFQYWNFAFQDADVAQVNSLGSKNAGKNSSKYQSLSSPSNLPDYFYSKNMFSDFDLKTCFKALFITPLVAYFLPFLNYLFVNRTPKYSLLDLWSWQERMFSGQLRVVDHHPYEAGMWGWPLMLRPIWYFFEGDGPGKQRGIIFLGNPFIMWGGLMVLALCLANWIFKRSRSGFLIFYLFSILYFSWAIIPRKLFFFYYYFPAACVLSFAWVHMFDFVASRFAHLNVGLSYTTKNFASNNVEHSKTLYNLRLFEGITLAIAFGFFVYFFPVISGMQIPEGSFVKWMWFQKWI